MLFSPCSTGKRCPLHFICVTFQWYKPDKPPLDRLHVVHLIVMGKHGAIPTALSRNTLAMLQVNGQYSHSANLSEFCSHKCGHETSNSKICARAFEDKMAHNLQKCWNNFKTKFWSYNWASMKVCTCKNWPLLLVCKQPISPHEPKL